MKNILKKMVLSSLIISTSAIPLLTVSCQWLRNVEDDIDTLDLGYVEDLQASTILKKFSELNPQVNMDYIGEEIYGNDHQAEITVMPPRLYYDRADITITYYSDISCDQEEYELTNPEQGCTVSFKILDSVDINNAIDKITFSFSDYYNFEEYFQYKTQLDSETRIYQITFSLKENLDKSLKIKNGKIWFYLNKKESDNYTNIFVTKINVNVEGK